MRRCEHDSQVPEAMVAQPVVDLKSMIPKPLMSHCLVTKLKVDPKAEELGSDNDDAKGTFKAGIEEHCLEFHSWLSLTNCVICVCEPYSCVSNFRTKKL